MKDILQLLFEAPDWAIALRLAWVKKELETGIPFLHKLYGVPQPAAWHPEICTGWHMELALAKLQSQPNVSFAEFCAVLLHDLGKGLTDPKKYPAHHGHEEAGVAPVEQVCKEFGLAKDVKDLCVFVAKHHLNIHKFHELTDRKQIELAKNILETGICPQSIGLACWSDAAGRLGLSYPRHNYTQAFHLNEVVAFVQINANNFSQANELIEWDAQHRIQLGGIRTIAKKYKKDKNE